MPSLLSPSKNIRRQNAKQKLASERNWALLSLRSAESQLHTIRRLFPDLNIWNAVQEIRRVGAALDAHWTDRKAALAEKAE